MSYQHCKTHDEDATNGCLACAAEHDARAREFIAKAFHDKYEELAPGFGYSTREQSRKDWTDLAPELRALMIATVEHLIDDSVITATDYTIDVTAEAEGQAMDQSGNIGPMTDEQIAAVYGNDTKEKHDALQRMLSNGGQIPIPKEDEPRVKKMNRKARRRWYAKQRKGK